MDQDRMRHWRRLEPGIAVRQRPRGYAAVEKQGRISLGAGSRRVTRAFDASQIERKSWAAAREVFALCGSRLKSRVRLRANTSGLSSDGRPIDAANGSVKRGVEVGIGLVVR